MTTRGFDRRQFMRAVGGAALIATISPGMVILSGPTTSWAYSLKKLTDQQAATLLQIVRMLFPHSVLGDAHYAVAIQNLDTTAQNNEDEAQILISGIERLNVLADGNWLEASHKRQKDGLKMIEKEPIFRIVWSVGNIALYNSPEVWEILGYEGPSFAKGGYLARGFNDLSWLPQFSETSEKGR